MIITDPNEFLGWYKDPIHKAGYIAGMAIALEQTLNGNNGNLHEPTRLLREAESGFDRSNLETFAQQYKTPLPEGDFNLTRFMVGYMNGAEEGSRIIMSVQMRFPPDQVLDEVKKRYMHTLLPFASETYCAENILPRLTD